MNMDKNAVQRILDSFVRESDLNLVSPADAIRSDLIGFRMYEQPLVGFAAADDPFFEQLLRPEVIGPHFHPPRVWLTEAKTVISFFLPYTRPVIDTNQLDPKWPSDEWLHARIEGQRFINALSAHLVERLTEAGWPAIAPSIHPDFKAWADTNAEEGTGTPLFSSNWSERHVAHVAGLGTFGLSAGFITSRGMAGRIGSVVTALPLAADKRPYSRYDEYCTHCGACVDRCQASAISPANGKNKRVCSGVMDMMKKKYAPRYGCGKCYVRVPCSRRIPAGARR